MRFFAERAFRTASRSVFRLYIFFFLLAPAYGQPPAESRNLEPGDLVERELSAGQRHSYAVTLSEGQFIKFEIRAKGVSLNVSFRRPDGRETGIFDSLGRILSVRPERVASVSGTYHFTVFARSRANAGTYDIRILELRPATQNELDLEEARDQMEQALKLQMEGKYLEARPMLAKALELREKVDGPDGFLVVEPLGRLAGTFDETGDYASAEPLRLRAVRVVELRRGPEHPELAVHLNTLGSVYEAKGDLSKAEEVYLRAVSILEKANQIDGHIGASLLGGLGSIYYRKDDLQNAEFYYQRARTVWEKLLGPDHFHLEPIYNFLGQIAYDRSDHLEARARFERALILREKAMGPDDPKLPNTLGSLATVFIALGDLNAAESLYKRALAIHQKGELTDVSVPDTLYGLARVAAARGAFAEAVKLQKEASEIDERHVSLNLAVGSERERLAFFNNYYLRAYRNISLHSSNASDHRALNELAATSILRFKGRVQDAMADSLAALRRRSGPEEQRLFDELLKTTAQLASLTIEGHQKNSSTEHQAKLKLLQEAREKLESEANRRSYGFYEKTRPVTLSSVQAAIPEGAALVEFAVFRPFDPKAAELKNAYGEPRYLAYVLRRKGEVILTDLGPASKINDLIERFRRSVRDPGRGDVEKLAGMLDSMVMRPVRRLTGDAKHLLISPDGDLSLVPIEALIDENGNHLLESFSVSYLTSGRDLLRMQIERESKGSAVVVADPVFGQPIQQVPTASTRASRRPAIARRSVTSTRNLSDTYFAPIAGTAREAASIQALFPEVRLFTGSAATETAVKSLGAPSILHIATHGFFLDNSDPDRKADAEIKNMRIPRQTVENPLLRSGLAFAGANQRSSGEDDGILTALEASGLNLWGTKLVVLSACDTGVGEIRNGEGVYGLRRSFVLAGAESLVMSMWPVSDLVTRELMTGYYKNLKAGMGRGEALRQVQLAMIKRPTRKHPFYWASFIHSGEWANLDGKR